MITSAECGKVAAALAKCQSEFPTIVKDKTATVEMRAGGKYTYRYANLASIFEAVLKILAKNELAVIQTTEFEHGQLWLRTRLAHASGEWLEGTWPMKTFERPQDQGSALTYARRYTISALLGIATDEDDDGAAASRKKAVPVITPAQVTALTGAAQVAGLNKDQFLDRLEKGTGTRDPRKLPASDYEKALDLFKPAAKPAEVKA